MAASVANCANPDKPGLQDVGADVPGRKVEE